MNIEELATALEGGNAEFDEGAMANPSVAFRLAGVWMALPQAVEAYAIPQMVEHSIRHHLHEAYEQVMQHYEAVNRG